MNSMNVVFEGNENTTNHILAFLEKHFEDFRCCRKEYEEALASVEVTFGKECADNLRDAIKARTDEDAIFSQSLGYQTNLECFRELHKPFFYETDFEDYLKQEARESIPARYEQEKKLHSFIESLSDEDKEAYSPIREYAVYLECSVPKLAHFIGFMVANSVLPHTELGYKPNTVLTVGYRSFLTEWFDVDVNEILE